MKTKFLVQLMNILMGWFNGTIRKRDKISNGMCIFTEEFLLKRDIGRIFMMNDILMSMFFRNVSCNAVTLIRFIYEMHQFSITAMTTYF